MAVEHCESVHKTAPAAARTVSVAGASAWANGAWVQIVASAGEDQVVTGFLLSKDNLGMITEIEVEIGVGGAGAEVAKGVLRWGNNANWRAGHGWLPLPVPGDWIASGQRVAMRHRKTDAGADVVFLGYTYWPKPLTGAVTPTTQPSKCLPSAAAGVTVTPSGTAWNNSAWVQITASTAAAWILGHATAQAGGTGISLEVDIGVGGAGSEVVVATLRYGIHANTGIPMSLFHRPALDAIGSGVRVAVRLRKDSTNVTTWNLSTTYMEKPL